MIRAYRVTRRGAEGSGGIYFARSAAAARYDYLLDAREWNPDLTFADLRCRRAPELDPTFQAVDGRQGLAPETVEMISEEHAAAARWNEAHPVGTPVTVRLDSGRNEELFETVTRSRALVVCDHAVVWVEGIASCYELSRVTAREVAHA